MKLLTYLHATLIAMLVLPLLYALAELQDANGEGMLYLKCLLIFIPIVVTEIAVRRLKNLGVYLILALAVTVVIWGVIRLFFGGSGVLYPTVMVAESIFVAFIRFRERLRLARQEKEDDLYAAPAISSLNQPSLGFLWYFAVMYLIGIIFYSKTLCDIALINGAIYFFIALAYTYMTETNHYLGLNKRTKSIPRKRLYAISAAMTGLFAAFVLIAILPSFFLAGQRRYTDIRTWLDHVEVEEYPPMVPSQTGGDGYAGDDWISILNEGEPPPEPSKLWTILGWIAAVAGIAFMAYYAFKMLRQVFLEFRESFDENGDRIEELDDESRQQEERLHLRRRMKADSEAEHIRRTYRRTIKKHRKELPAPYESPSELEKNAGLFEDAEMKALHKKYEHVRYGQEEHSGMKNISDGYIKISDELTIFPNFTFEQFKRTTFYHNQDGIRFFYLDKQQKIADRNYIVGLFFRNEIIYMVSLICCDKEFSETEERKRKLLHDAILEEWEINGQKEFHWGRFSSEYDARGNVSSINITYF